MTSTSLPPSLSATPPHPATNDGRPIPLALVAAVAGPLLLAVTNALVGFGLPRVNSTAEAVRSAGDAPVLTELVGALGLAAVVLIVPGVWAVALRLGLRTPVLAGIGGWLMASGYVLATSLSTESLTALAVASTGLDPATYAAAMDQHQPVTTMIMYSGFGLGALLGGVVLGVAMLRQRGGLASWVGWVLVASEPIRVAGLLLGLAFLPPLASVLIAVAFGATLLGVGRRSREA